MYKGRRFYFNPVYLLFMLYFSANLYSFLLVSGGGEIFADQLLVGFGLDVAFKSIMLLIATLFFFIFLYFSNLRFPAGATLFLSDLWGVVIVLYQAFYLINTLYYGVNVAGVEDSATSPFDIFFSLLDPDSIFIIITILLRSPKLFWISVIVFLISSILRGWGGGFFIVPIMVLCRHYQFGYKCVPLFFLSLSFIALFAASPFLIEIKWLLRAGLDPSYFFNNIMGRGYVLSLISTFDYMINRFQMFGHVSLIVENSGVLAEAYETKKYIPYWGDGLFQWIFLRLFDVDIVQLNKYMVYYFFDSDNSAYSTNPGVAGWLSILGLQSQFFMLYLCVIVFFPAYFLRKYAGAPLFLLCYCLVFVWLFHGWVGAYVNFIMYALLILFVSKIRVYPRIWR